MGIKFNQDVTIKTNLSPQDLTILEQQLPSLGKIGEQGLQVVRGLAAAVSGLESATSELRLTLMATEKKTPQITIKMTFEGSNAKSSTKGLMQPNVEAGIPITKLALEPATILCLTAAKIHSVELLLEKTPAQLRELPGFGHTQLHEVRDRLSQYGLHRRRDNDMKLALGASTQPGASIAQLRSGWTPT